MYTFYSMNFSYNFYTHVLTNTETFLCITVMQNDHPSPVLEVQDGPKVQEIKSTSRLLKIVMVVFSASS